MPHLIMQETVHWKRTFQLMTRIIFHSKFCESPFSPFSYFITEIYACGSQQVCAFVICCFVCSVVRRRQCGMLWCSTCFVGLVPRLWPDKIFTFNVQTGNQSKAAQTRWSASVQLADWRFERRKARQTVCALTMITAGAAGRFCPDNTKHLRGRRPGIKWKPG